jgi:8-oxo-dGTP pyrophosphatase MutT (NUDIX family)
VTISKNKPSFIKSLEKILSSKLPGEKAHDIMRTGPKFPKPLEYLKKKAIPSAVLILLFPNNNTFNFILTLRSKKVKTHKGQISLPGGVQEQDESLEKTALREAEEEIGVSPETVELIGRLSTLYVPFSGFDIHPYVGWATETPEINISVEEVDKIIYVPVTELIDSNNLRIKNTSLRGIPVKMPYFNLKNEIVWGATSMILSEFKQLIT